MLFRSSFPQSNVGVPCGYEKRVIGNSEPSIPTDGSRERTGLQRKLWLLSRAPTWSWVWLETASELKPVAVRPRAVASQWGVISVSSAFPRHTGDRSRAPPRVRPGASASARMARFPASAVVESQLSSIATPTRVARCALRASTKRSQR